MFSASRSGARSRLTFSNASSSRPRSVSMNVQPRDSYGIRRTSSEERKSGNGGIKRFSGVRNSLSNEPKGAVKETRPLTDKAYQKKKVVEIVEFLQENDFKIPITPAKLLQASKKDFELIFQFLYRFLDPTFELKNLEDDAPRVLKNLGYPYIPNKSAFIHVARTNFSSLLGILLYLMDLVKSVMDTDLSQIYKTADTENPEEHALILSYILECQQSGVENDEEMMEVFEKIVRDRNTEDLSALLQEREMNNEKLSEVQNELNKIERLEKECDCLDSRIKQYEEYFLGMEKRTEKREASISKLTEDLQAKRSLQLELEEKLSQRQAIYDAQGFDGKKQLSHYEEQIKELKNTLEKQKNRLKELQDECWDLELSYTRVIDKGNELCKGFNQTCAQIKDTTKTVMQTLQNIKGPEVHSVINTFRLEFPEFPQQFNRSSLSSWMDNHEGALEEVQKKINTTNVIIKTLLSAKSEELTEIEMKKSQLSSKLKCAASAELQKEHDLLELEKQAVEEVKTLEKLCDESLKQLDELRKEIREKEDHSNKLKADLLEVEKLKKDKMEMLDKYLEQQKKFFEQLVSNVEELSKEAEIQGDEITSAIQELLKSSKNKD